MTDGKTLKEFALENQAGYGGSSCIICELPADVLEQVNAIAEEGIYKTTLRRWLVEEHKLPVTERAVDKHFADGHAKEAKRK